MNELEHVKQVYEQAEIHFKIKLAFIPTRADGNTIVVLACVARARVAGEGSLAVGGTRLAVR